MSSPVDLTNLRSMTDGDRDLERALFDEFMTSFEDGSRVLAESLAKESSENWRKQAHALKGIAVNLGAEDLGALCKQAQENYTAESADKQPLLQNIEAEYQSVKSYLHTVMTVAD